MSNIRLAFRGLEQNDITAQTSSIVWLEVVTVQLCGKTDKRRQTIYVLCSCYKDETCQTYSKKIKYLYICLLNRATNTRDRVKEDRHCCWPLNFKLCYRMTYYIRVYVYPIIYYIYMYVCISIKI